MLQIHPSKTPIILDKVASLTTIRDIEIFEFSFMKTLAGMLNVNIISLYKCQSFNESCHLIQFDVDVDIATSEDGDDESHGIHIEDIKVPEEIKRAQDWIESTGEIYSIKKEDKFNIVYPVTGLKGGVGYLSIIINHQLSDAENLVISSLLSISQNFYGLLEENQKDKLTGLLNRKTFDDNITKIQNILSSRSDDPPYLAEEKRQNDSSDEFWLCILDIDFFKKVNDTFGHVYGDEVLLMLSQEMRKTFRPNDLLFRFGGEEFVVVVKVENKQKAEQAFERFRVAIEKFRFPQVGQVTISLGATLIMQQHAIASDIVGRADDALYYAKEHGRNKLFFYEDLLAAGIFTESVEDGDIELF